MSEIRQEFFQAPAQEQEHVIPMSLVEGAMSMAQVEFEQAATALNVHQTAWDNELQSRESDLRAFVDIADISLDTAEILHQRLTVAGTEMREQFDLKRSLDARTQANQADIEAKQLELDTINSEKDAVETDVSDTYTSIQEQKTVIDSNNDWLNGPSIDEEDLTKKLIYEETYTGIYNTELRSMQDKATALGAKLINLIGGRQELITRMMVTDKDTQELAERTKVCEQRILILCSEIVVVKNEISELNQPEIAHSSKALYNEEVQLSEGDSLDSTDILEAHQQGLDSEALTAKEITLASARTFTIQNLELNKHSVGGRYAGRLSVVGVGANHV